LKHVTQRVNFITTRARLMKALYKNGLIDLEC